MSIVQNITGCFNTTIGSSGISRREYNRILKKSEKALSFIKIMISNNNPLFLLPFEKKDLISLEPLVRKFRHKFNEIIILGTGGSSLGAQAICSLASYKTTRNHKTPKLTFVDNVDSERFESLFKRIDYAKTGFVVISKSGNTLETISQFHLCFNSMEKKIGIKKASKHFVLITQNEKNILRTIAKYLNILILEHDKDLGGRYSAFSLVGLFPAMLAGLDVYSFRDGAKTTLNEVLKQKNSKNLESFKGAAIAFSLAKYRRKANTVLMPYSDQLISFIPWFRQLWAESLGKGGSGTTPIGSIGTVDQHSQLQLYIDGPDDKFFTLIKVTERKKGKKIRPIVRRNSDLNFLYNRTIDDVMNCQLKVTKSMLIRNKRPVRLLEIAKIDEKGLGSLMMHFILETIIVGNLDKINVFNQPAVESGKKLAKKYLRDI